MSETPPPGVQVCDACGKKDTDPMIHVAYGSYQKDERTTIAEPSFHYDCLPDDIRAQLVGPANANTLAGVEAAESGTKGEALRELLQSLPSDNDLED